MAGGEIGRAGVMEPTRTDSGSLTPDGDHPTEDELHTLRKVADSLPLSAWFVGVVELCERFAYYGLSVSWMWLENCQGYHTD